ncbi:MAG: hypothetical protein JO332_16905 [Planctomycetaceae bacterium]|nr:hypothetical protein [Planctomycetaceae bacterium]
MMDLDTLTSSELARICREAGEECAERIAQIAAASDPSDRSLQILLERMASEEFAQARAIEGSAYGPSNGDGFRAFIRRAILSLTRSLGEGKLPRDVALFYAECLAEELARFYRMLAEHSREAGIQDVCHQLSDRERGQLRFLREVVFQ